MNKRISTILLLEEDDDARGLLVENLSRENYRVLVAVNQENAIDLIKNLVQTPDIFLVNQVYSLEEYLTIIRDIYQHNILSSDTPTVLIADQYSDYLTATEKQIDDNIFIVYLENAQQLLDLLDRLLNDRKMNIEH